MAGKPSGVTARIFIKTFGCTYNISDSEIMAGLLENAGFKIVNSLEEADLVVINSCTVKNSAEAKFYTYLKKVMGSGKKAIAAGCVPQTDMSRLANVSVAGVNRIQNIVSIAEETLNGGVIRDIGNREKRDDTLNLFPRIRKNPIVEIIPINSGCLGNCSYCKTKQARGSLVSFCPEKIVMQAENAVKNGAKELWITSQDTGAYGKDLGTDLPALLKKITETDGNFKIRLGMCNPNFLVEYLDEMIRLFQHEKMFRFAHVPVQAGSGRILKLMNRKYSAEDYRKIVSELKEKIPDITIATDIICGFPTETEEEFCESIKLIEETEPDVLNISRYWARPGTEAAKMKQLGPNIIKERSGRMKKTFSRIALENNEKWIGKECTIIIDEEGKNVGEEGKPGEKGEKTFVGRNESYKPVILAGKHFIGEEIRVKIKNATMNDLRTF